jgi:glycosyltransferase involved in cell wall biosynthesis
MDRQFRFLFIEPFYGGSHKDFADGLIRASAHTIDLVTLPARFWKWRMRGAALHFLNKIDDLESYDGLITSDILGLADFKALCRVPCPPAMLYFHENQLTYPLAPGKPVDYQYGFTNITTALAADRILFNSHTHFNAFFAALPRFIGMMPEFKPHWAIDTIRQKSQVMYPGCQFDDAPAEPIRNDAAAPLIIWNHRWEFDKNPADFFSALDSIVTRGGDFRLALLGENYQAVPKEFIAAQQKLKDRIVHCGYVSSKSDYCRWLAEGDIVVSTAIQENFGIAVIEAIRHGCLPLLPNRLSYPEIIPTEFHGSFLYSNQEDLVNKLFAMIEDRHRLRDQGTRLARSMKKHSWQHRIHRFDEALTDMVCGP